MYGDRACKHIDLEIPSYTYMLILRKIQNFLLPKNFLQQLFFSFFLLIVTCIHNVRRDTKLLSYRVQDAWIAMDFYFVFRFSYFDLRLLAWIFVSGFYADDIAEKRASDSVRGNEDSGRATRASEFERATDRKLCFLKCVTGRSFPLFRSHRQKLNRKFPETRTYVRTTFFVAIRTIIGQEIRRIYTLATKYKSCM